MRVPWQIDKSLYASLFALSLFGFPAVSTLPVFLGIESRPVSVIYRAIVLVASLVLLARALAGRRPFIDARYAAIAVSLMVVMSGRLVWDALVAKLPLSLEWGDYSAFVLGVTFLPSLPFLVRTDDSTLQCAYRLSLRLGVATALLIIAAAAVGISDLSSLRRLATEVLNPITVGHIGVSLFALLAMAPQGTGTAPSPGAWTSIGKFLALGLASILVIASASKGPALAWVAVIAVWLVISLRASSRAGTGVQGAAPALVLVAVVGLCAVYVNTFLHLTLVDRFTDFTSDTSTSDRVRILSEAISQFEESPLLGSAVVEYTSRFYPHNIVVESLMAGGVIAFVLLGLMLLLAGRHAIVSGLTGSSSLWLAVLFLQFSIDAMFSGSLYFSPQFWVLGIVMLGLAPPHAEKRLVTSH